MNRSLASLRPAFFLAALLLAVVPAVRAQGVPLATVSLQEVDLSYPAEAVVEALQQSIVAAQAQGRVVQVYVDAGDTVRKGDVLMRIDEREAAQAVAGADASLAQAQAELANAKATYERTRNLFAQKFVSQAALDQAQAAWRAAEAQVKAAAANRGAAATGRSFTTVTAPISGIVARRHTELGEMAQPGKPLLTVYDPKSLRVTASIPQYRLAEVRASARAKVEFPESGKWVDGVSMTVLPTADARTHVAEARVQLPEGLDVVPGMFARAHFVIGRAMKLVIPRDAVVRRGEVTGVYVADAKAGFRLRQVRLGESLADNGVEVLAGLSAGEKVALDPIKAGLVLKQNGRS